MGGAKMRRSLNRGVIWNFTAMSQRHKSLSIENVNPNARKMEYAVRGPVVALAGKIAKDLKEGAEYPFSKVFMANVGDCHACGQQPISFIRQLASTCTNPDQLMDVMPADVVSRAKSILLSCGGGSIGAYSASPGLEIVRKHVAAYIEGRDGQSSDMNNIILTNGASDGIKTVLGMYAGGARTGVMIPIPQYPLYSATLTELDIAQVNYYLDEEKEWALTTEELERAFDGADCRVGAIVVINPGNPTGSVLDKANIESIIDFAHKHSLAILADEVYQHNIYADNSQFWSFKKVLCEMGPRYSDVELFSFMSCSKGFMGECGARGGYFEMHNIDPEVSALIHKSFTARLCCNLYGQIILDAIVNPPSPGEPSYDTFKREKEKVLSELHKKSQLVTRAFQSTKNMSCVELKGAMYAFPQIHLPEKAIAEAERQNVAPDALYCFEMLKQAGVCLVPGSGFCQKPGTHHFRTTILQDISHLPEMIEKVQNFHNSFVAKYS